MKELNLETANVKSSLNMNDNGQSPKFGQAAAYERRLNEERKHYSLLVIPRNANALEQGVMSELRRAHVSSQEINEIAEPCWNELDAMDWYSLDDVEMCHMMVMVSLKSVTEESYKKFSRVVIPGDLFYEGFEGEEMPALARLKKMFPYYFACVQYGRDRADRN